MPCNRGLVMTLHVSQVGSSFSDWASWQRTSASASDAGLRVLLREDRNNLVSLCRVDAAVWWLCLQLTRADQAREPSRIFPFVVTGYLLVEVEARYLAPALVRGNGSCSHPYSSLHFGT